MARVNKNDIDKITAHIDAAIDIAKEFTTIEFTNTQFEKSEVYDSGYWCCVCGILHSVKKMIEDF